MSLSQAAPLAPITLRHPSQARERQGTFLEGHVLSQVLISTAKGAENQPTNQPVTKTSPAKNTPTPCLGENVTHTVAREPVMGGTGRCVSLSKAENDSPEGVTEAGQFCPPR